MRNFWTDERIEKLQRLAATKSAGQISVEFDGAVSRSAVIGKCARLGIPLGGTAGRLKATGGAVKRDRRKKPKPNPAFIAAKKRGDLPPSKDPLPAEPPAPVECIPIPITEIKDGLCHWPLWKPDTPTAERRYCGAGTKPRIVYCDHHRRAARG